MESLKSNLDSVEVTRLQLIECIDRLPVGKRSIVALAGAPASGKSTLAVKIVEILNKDRQRKAACLQMDGYHLGNIILRDMGRLKYKGAPDTFDVAGLASMLCRLRGTQTSNVYVPIFDRNIETACAATGVIPASTDIIVVEGNYLLVDTKPWDCLRAFFDLRVLLRVPEADLRQRLIKRWETYGLSANQIVEKIEDNDLPNGRFVIANSKNPDMILVC